VPTKVGWIVTVLVRVPQQKTSPTPGIEGVAAVMACNPGRLPRLARSVLAMARQQSY
jgi:hypothetical protein